MIDVIEKLTDLLGKAFDKHRIPVLPFQVDILVKELTDRGVLVLPFGIDDYAYTIEDGKVYESRVHSFEVGYDCQGALNIVYTDDDGFLFDLSDIGETVFESESAAQAALRTEEK